jgi:hypothetical protein
VYHFRAMSLKEWERDVINRQRNIVFPDTILNEGRFYRNIASGKAVFTWGQKISLLLIVAFSIVVAVVDFASNFGILLSDAHHSVAPWNIGPTLITLAWLLFWIFLTVKCLLPQPAPARKRRRGYRRAGENENQLSGGKTSTAGLRRNA